jgi:homoaconitase/3-isopropylmalate dehydratase large subunit
MFVPNQVNSRLPPSSPSNPDADGSYFATHEIDPSAVKRKVPSVLRPIVQKLEITGLAAVYRTAGFGISLPESWYGVGMSADEATKGQVWLSWQNWNFEIEIE